MTKVLQVMAGAPVGGAEEFFMRLVPALSRAGVDQRVLLRSHTAREDLLRNTGIPVETARFGGLLDFSTRSVVRRAVDAYAPGIVLAWMSRAVRYCPAGEHILAARLGGYYDLKYYADCDHLIGNTQAIRDYLVDAGWPADRAWYIPNFVDAERADAVDRSTLDTPAEAPLLLALGRLHRNKAFDTLIQALEQIPNAYLWIAGDGPLKTDLHNEARARNVSERVRFLGWRKDVAALLAASDVLVCPSRHEPLGNVVIEGWAHGVPVVAAEADGPRALIEHERNGLLAPIDEADALAAAIRRVIGNGDLSEALATAGHATYEAAYTEANVVRQYIDFFEKVAP